MREIKFRAWDKEENKLKYSNEYPDLPCFFTLNQWQLGQEMFPMMQFTGLLDKNGKEIYEGDYLQDEPDGDGKSILHRVVWMEDRLRFEIETWQGGDDWEYGCYDELWDYANNMKLKDFEIIGNIYENPELLSIKGSNAE